MAFCPACLSSTLRKYGTDAWARQKFRCVSCGKQFTEATGTPRSGMRFPQRVVDYGLNLHFRHRLVLRDVRARLGERGIPVSHVAVHTWVKKFGPSFQALSMRHKEYARRWHLDMAHTRLNGRTAFLWSVYDANGVPLAVRAGQRKYSHAGEVLRDAQGLAGFKPEAVLSHVEGVQEELAKFTGPPVQVAA
jgi:transposase-like protein